MLYASCAFSQDLFVCGLTVDLSADIENYSDFSWFCADVNGTFSDKHNATTTFNSYRYDSNVKFYYNASVDGEIVSDTIYVTFIEPPTAVISTCLGDTITCGLYFGGCSILRAEDHGDGINGYWYEENPSTQFGEDNQTVNSTITDVTVSSYGRHDFYWIEYTGTEDNPDMCRDTSGPWTINFIEPPTANIPYSEITVCGSEEPLQYQLHADFNGVGVGRWSVNRSSYYVTFDDRTDPNTMVHSFLNIYNYPSTPPAVGGDPYTTFYWTVQNTEYCSDRDSVRIVFSGVPLDSVKVIPPKCIGEATIITAYDETLPSYDWIYSDGAVLDSVETNSLGGAFRIFVHWERGNSHVVALASTNQNECRSAAIIEEPPVPNYRYRIYDDPCALGKGSIEFLDTTGVYAFFWTDTDVGPVITNPDMGYPITDYRVYDLPAGRYTVRADYQTFNSDYITSYQHYFGNYACSDFLTLGIDTASIEAEIAVNSNVDNLVAPYASRVYFTNTTHYNGHMGNTICEWHFGDGDVENYCGYYYVHDYTESGCYNPYLIVMSGDYPECRDTAFIDECLFVRNDIPDYFYDNINVFPNPANDILNITSSETISEIEIVNTLGQVVKRIEVNADNAICNVNKLPNGIYVVRIRTLRHAQGAEIQRKFIKE